MPFDFTPSPLRIYGIFPTAPYPLEVSIYGYCQMACQYCFANLNRQAAGRELHEQNTTAALLRRLDRELQSEHSPYGFFLREKYPVCFSNTTDPFQREEQRHRSSEAFLAWCAANKIPVWLQTRGADVLLDDWERYAPLLEPGRVVVYLSICHQDDRDRRKHEPGAPRLEQRWELARRLTDHGIPVVAACNPYLREWVPDPVAYCQKCVEAGIKGIWLEALHFTKGQGEVLARPYQDLLLKGNLAPMYLIGQLKAWYAATEAAGLDFFPTPHWDAYFGHPATFPEACDPAWHGGQHFDAAFRIAADIHDTATEWGRLVLVTWPSIAKALEVLKVPNPLLDTSPFWYAYNVSVKADHAAWKARLGPRAHLWEILRYWWNHPWENRGFVWHHPLMHGLTDTASDTGLTDDDGDLLGVFHLKSKHHGGFWLNQDAVNDDNAVVWEP